MQRTEATFFQVNALTQVEKFLFRFDGTNRATTLGEKTNLTIEVSKN